MRKYTHHFDFISDFMWLGDKKQLVATRSVCSLRFHARVDLSSKIELPDAVVMGLCQSWISARRR